MFKAAFIFASVLVTGSYFFCLQCDWRGWTIDIEAGAVYLNANTYSQNSASFDVFETYSRGVYEEDLNDHVRRLLPVRVLRQLSGWVLIVSIWPLGVVAGAGAAWDFWRQRRHRPGFSVCSPAPACSAKNI